MTDLATALASAWRERRALNSAAWEDSVGDATQAYTVQEQVEQATGWFGAAVPRHWKSGGPARDAVLTHAPLPPAGVRASPANCGDMHFNTPGIESEIALRLGEAVTPERAAALTPESAAGLIDAMTVRPERTTASPEVAIAASVACLGSRPARSSSRYRINMNRE